MPRNDYIISAVLASLFGATWMPAAEAGVVVLSNTRVDGTGIVAMAGMTATTTETIDGDRARTETRMQFDSGLVRAVTRRSAQDQVEIVLLDQGRMLQLEPGKKRYTEQSLADARLQLAQVMAQAERGGAGMPVAFDTSQCDWSSARSSARRELRERVAGIDSERWHVRAAQTCTHRQTRQRCELALDSKLWVSNAADALAEQRRFQQRYAEALGLSGAGPRATRERTRAMFGQYGNLWSESAERIAAIKGQTLKSQSTLVVAGTDCDAASASDDRSHNAATGDGDDQPTSAGVGRGMATVATSTAVTEKTGRWRLGDLSGQLVGSLLAKRKKAQPDAATTPTSGQGASNGQRSLISVSYEVVSIIGTDVQPATFEIPAGYKLAKAR